MWIVVGMTLAYGMLADPPYAQVTGVTKSFSSLERCNEYLTTAAQKWPGTTLKFVSNHAQLSKEEGDSTLFSKYIFSCEKVGVMTLGQE